MTATDGAGLLDAILADPADDGLRLIFADWLEDNGEPARAEFIRAQIALVGVRSECGSESGDYLCRSTRCRLCPLIRRQNAAWLETPPGPSPGSVVGGIAAPWAITVYAGPDHRPPVMHVRRGFVESALCSLGDWMKHGPEIARSHPITRVTLTDREPWYEDGQDRWYWYALPDPAKTPHHAARLRAGAQESRHSVPGVLFDGCSEAGTAFTFASRELAIDDLSGRLIAWAKKQETAIRR